MMSSVSSRVFQDRPAVRERVPLLVGLVGSSGSGKTFSALRLATGIQRVVGGDIGYVDTEARRALHYADRFKFRHVAFEAPFGPLDYLAAIEHFAGQGVRTIVVDSMSHEHEGPGGVLEMHEAEADRLAKLWKTSLDAVKIAAWQKPKSERRRLVNTILQLPVNFVFCFRAKEKLKIASGEKPKPLGWMPIAGEEFVYEMTLNCLLYPNSGGVPSWHPDEMGEKAIVKLPAQFREMFAERQALSEATGERLASWAEGDASTPESQERTAILDALKQHLVSTCSNTDAKASALGRAFGVRKWNLVECMPVDELTDGLNRLRAESKATA